MGLYVIDLEKYLVTANDGCPHLFFLYAGGYILGMGV